MKIEDLVPTVETCQKLADAGIEFHSYFRWYSCNGDYGLCNKDSPFSWTATLIHAPMVQELLEKLPIHIMHKSWFQRIEISNYQNYKDRVVCESGIYCRYGNAVEFKGKNLSEILAQMLLWIYENNYLKE